jgi:hypothetical protein
MKPFETVGGHSAFGRCDQAWSDSDPGTYAYAILRSGPDVDPDEVEVSSATSVEVVVLWGTTVLHVEHLTPPRSFYVGEGKESGGACDYVVPPEKIGTQRAPIVLVENGSIDLVVLPQATGTIQLPGQCPVPIKDMIASGRTSPCDEVPGAVKVALVSGARAHLEIDGMVFNVAAVPPGKVPAHGMFVGEDTSAPIYIGLSLLAHVGLVAAMAFFVPQIGGLEEEGASRDQRYLIMHYITATAEPDRVLTDQTGETPSPDPEGGTGERAIGEEGTMGNPNSNQTGHHFGVKGPAGTVDPHVAREIALQEAGEIGMIGVLKGSVRGNPNAPTAPWGRDDSLGTDPISARGAMWGDGIGDTFGGGAWGLTGIGEGGGGSGLGAGLGNFGDLGRGAGKGNEQGFGMCDQDDCGHGLGGRGRLRPTHATRAPVMRSGTITIGGRLPAEVIQRIVRQNFGRFRLCYENALRSNPNLQGRVEIRFVIGRDGAVTSASNGSSDLPNASVVQCVSKAYYSLSFPPPENGIVTVVYPIMFSPSGQ